MGIGMSIVFTGLCALVTDGQHGSGQVLLVDAKGVGEVRGVELPEHSATLAVSLASLVNADSSRPDRVVTVWSPVRESSAMAGQLGLWDLKGTEVRILVQGGNTGGLHVFDAAGASSWPAAPKDPNNPDGWRDLRFIADMKPLAGDSEIDPALVATNEAGLSRAVASRIHLDAGVLEAGIPSAPDRRDDTFDFADASGRSKLRQALTDSIRWNLDTDATAVVIEIQSITGGPTKRLVLKPNATRHDVFVSNLPAVNGLHDAHQSVSLEEMAALHFGVYYKLLRHQPPDQPLPRRWSDLTSRGSGFGGSVRCPPATFTQN